MRTCRGLCVGISRDSWHKRRATGGKKKALRKKRKFEMGRPPANTKVCTEYVDEGHVLQPVLCCYCKTLLHVYHIYSLHLRGSIRSGPEAVTLNIVLSDWMLVTSPGAQRVRRSQQVGPCVSVPPCIAAVTRKTRLLDVVYNASNNELVRTKTLVKNCIVQIDATPFRQW